MGLSDIEKKSFGYNLVKSLVRFWHNIFFYRKFIVLGKSNIPTDKPLLFTPNIKNSYIIIETNDEHNNNNDNNINNNIDNNILQTERPVSQSLLTYMGNTINYFKSYYWK